MIHAVYHGLCPVCHQELTDQEIAAGVCAREQRPLAPPPEQRVTAFERLFQSLHGFRLRKIQRLWAKRILAGHSECLLAPTGIGKTVFGLSVALFLARQEHKKCYLVFPTTTILRNLQDRIAAYREKMDAFPRVIVYTGDMRRDEKEDVRTRIERGAFDLLLTTNAFLARNFNLIRNHSFDFIFIDDVDSFLRASRNLDRILSLRAENGVLLLASATGRAGRGARMLREKAGLETGALRETLRKIADFAGDRKDLDQLCQLLERLGPGGLLYAPSEAEARHLETRLRERIPVKRVVTGASGDLADFVAGRVHLLIGVARPYGLLVRGIDLPEVIRYAVFWGAPAFRFPLRRDRWPQGILRVLARKLYRLREDWELLGLLRSRRYDVLEQKVRELLAQCTQTEQRELGIEEDGQTLWIPDVKTYIQASGRTSRLFAGGLSQGLSILLDEAKYLLPFREAALLWDVEFRDLDDRELDTVLEQVDRDRQAMREPPMEYDPVTPLLLVVESPHKARQIARFFGRPIPRGFGAATGYEVFTGEHLVWVVASIGHVVDLIMQDVGFHAVERDNGSFILHYAPIKRCRACGHQFADVVTACPRCGGSDLYDAARRMQDLRQMAAYVENVVVGTDPDTEGEKIAWDVVNLLRPFAREFRRAEFHEVTRNAILEALRNPRDIDLDRVHAQMVRRVEDRLMGFELSQRVQRAFHQPGLSAGRAQSPVLGWVVEREQALRRRVPVFRNAELRIRWQLADGRKIPAGPQRWKFFITVVREETRERVVPPFTTDTLLRDAQRVLKMGPDEVMRRAQKLFELGLITYHRTDSPRISDRGLSIARYLLKDQFRGRTFSGPGAHEGIRPTRPVRPEELRDYVAALKLVQPLERMDIALYRLIFLRFLASQAPPCVEVVRVYRIEYRGQAFEEERLVRAEGPARELYPYAFYVVPELPTGDVVLSGTVGYEPEAFPYRPADLVRLMKERGIGRPSTYAVLMERLFQRNYVVERDRFVRATGLGKRVYRFLAQHYGDFISEQRTRLLEQRMGDVENHRVPPEEVLATIWDEARRLR